MVMDLDLAVSVSPLGVLHSLGVRPGDPIASSSTNPVPGAFGTLQLPYDLAAMRFYPEAANGFVLHLHKRFCEMAPPGDRWRFECLSMSPFIYILLIDKTKSAVEPYKMASSYNGAILYPLKLVRDKKPRYSTGDDGQQCEHVDFNLSLGPYMYVNPKWGLPSDPAKRAGPSGTQATSMAKTLFFRPESLVAYILTVVPMFVFILCVMSLTSGFLYPLWILATRRFCGKETEQRRHQQLPS